MCTDLCPRYLLGHPIEPHEFMRSATTGVTKNLSPVITSYSIHYTKLYDEDMNEAIKASIEAQKVMHSLSMDSREKIIQNIKKLTYENAETLAVMGVEETGMGNIPHKILKHRLVAEKTPGTEDITTTAWSGDRGLTLVEMGLV